MMHTRLTYGLIALGLMCSTAGCTFQDGSPWGEVRPELEVRFDAQERVTPEGTLRIGNGYELELESLELELGAMRVELSPEGSAASAGFDPAMPPAGYSLCHNGHCHADDGRLVDYEDIALELAQSNGNASSLALVQAFEQRVMLTPTQGASPRSELALCTNACELATQGELTRVIVTIPTLSVRGRVFDGTSAQRLPEEGFALDVEVPWAQEASQVITANPGDFSEGVVTLRGELILEGDVFNDIPWTEITAGSTTFTQSFAPSDPVTLQVTTP